LDRDRHRAKTLPDQRQRWPRSRALIAVHYPCPFGLRVEIRSTMVLAGFVVGLGEDVARDLNEIAVQYTFVVHLAKILLISARKPILRIIVGFANQLMSPYSMPLWTIFT
jgi:hypothetical protein